MIPRLVPEISPLDAFCDAVVGVVGIGDSRSWISKLFLGIHMKLAIYYQGHDIESSP